MEFKPSNPLSIGMEMEFQLLDANTLDLIDGIMPLMQLYPDSPYVKPEFIQNTVEVCSKICHNLADLEDHLLAVVRDLQAKCKQLGMTLCGAGTHPFGERLAIITPLPRYLHMEKATGYLGHTQVTFATHVHVGMASGEDAIAMMRELKAYLPLLIALSASSPFWRGYDTGYAAYRHRILAASRSYGIPPTFDSWNEFADFLQAMQHAGVFKTVNDIHWDIRPRPHLGTLELRVMDAQSTVAQAIALAGFVRTLVTYLRHTANRERPPGLPEHAHWWIEKDNHFQAARLALSAKYIKGEQATVVKMRTLLEDTLAAVEPTAIEFHEHAYLERLQERIKTGLSYQRQQDVYQRTDSLKAVVGYLSKKMETELNAYSND